MLSLHKKERSNQIDIKENLEPSSKDMYIYIFCSKSPYQNVDSIDWVRTSNFDMYICRILNRTFSSLIFRPFLERDSGGIVVNSYFDKKNILQEKHKHLIVPFYCMIPGTYKFCAYPEFPKQIMEALLHIFRFSSFVEVLDWDI